MFACTRWLALLLALVLFSPSTGMGQSLHFRTIEVEADNEPISVKLLHQDNQGYIWLGTAQGLYRYNGLEFRYYPVSSDSSSLRSVSALHQDNKGKLWVGYEDGTVATLQQNALQAIVLKDKRINSSIASLLVDAQQVLWIATSGDGAFYKAGEHLKQITTRQGLPDNYAYTLASGKGNTVWVGTDRGIGICSLQGDKVKVQVIDSKQGLPDNIVTALSPGVNGDMWIGTQSAGFFLYKGTKQFLKPKGMQDWSGGSVVKIVADKQGPWVGTDGTGLYRFSESSGLKQHAANQKVTDLLKDREGNLWIANNTAAISFTDPTLQFIFSVKGQELGAIHAVLAPSPDSVWFSNDQGLFLMTFTQGSEPVLRKYLKSPAYKNLKIVSLYQDEQGSIWVGTFGQGAFKLNPETEQVLPVSIQQGLINENVLSITVKGNTVWFATLGGLSRCTFTMGGAGKTSDFQFRNFTHENALGINYIYQVFIDSKDRVWFATDGKGLTMLQGDTFYNYAAEAGLKSSTVYSITEDKFGTIWFSTSDAGIYSFDGKIFRNYGLKEGLRNLNITAISTDKKGHLLIKHELGIDLLHILSGKVLYFGEEKGLSPQETDLNAVAAAPDAVWFGTQQGLLQYNTAFTPHQFQPVTRIQDVQVFFNSVLGSGKQEFSHDENHFTFDYAGLWYENPEEVTYRVKLEGYDRVWTNSRNHTITYPNLPPGQYVFKVSAAINGNFEGAQEQIYTFRIAAPFWRTYLFYALVLLALLLGFYLFIKARDKRLQKAQKLERDKVMFQFETLKSQVNPHFLFNSFNTLISTIEDDPEAAVEYVEKLSDFFREMLVHREKDVITLQQELDLIRNYYFLQQKRYGSNLQLSIQVDESSLDRLVAPLTLQLLLENAIKHNVISRTRPLQIEIFTEVESVVVRNNLQPKQTQEASTKVGLENIRNRYFILCKREMEIEQTATHYQVTIPLLKAAAHERIAN